jgi:signal transduction histidine kinase/ligand-binding sensor domain-containing protein/AraC-like DNA-binding protein
MTALHVVGTVVALVAPGPQDPGVPPGPRAPESFIHQVWTVENGLPVNAIQRVLQGSDGYLWLATWDGLVRFDGVRFTIFNTGNSDGLPSNRIADLIEAPDGSLWMHTEQGHLVRLRDGVFTHVGTAHGLGDRSTRSIHVDASGQLWVGTVGGVGRIEGDRFLPVAEQAIRAGVDAVLHDAAGDLWVGTQRNGLLRLRRGDITRFDTTTALASNSISSLHDGPDGTTWIGTAAGVHRYRHGSIERLLRDSGAPMDSHVLSVQTASSRGETWVTAEDGTFVIRDDRLHVVNETPGRIAGPQVRFHPGGAVWHSVGDRLYREGTFVFQIPLRDAHDDRTVPMIQDFGWDDEGSLWIGTHSSGLFRLKPSLFTVFSTAEGLAHRNTAVVMEDRSGAVWIGTHGRGFTRIAAGQAASYTPDAGFPAFIHALHQDRNGDLWLGTLRRGILYCRLPAMRCGDPPGGQPARDAGVSALHQDASGDLWAGTDRGLFRLRGGVWERMAEGEDPEPAMVRVFLEAPDGTLWMGTNGSGLLAYRDDRFSRIDTAAGLPGDLIRSLYLDGRGRLWVGTEGRGLARVAPALDPGGRLAAADVRTIRQREGLFDEVIHQILEDDFGRLWMSSNRGIFWVDLAELNDVAEGRARRVHSTVYTERDGLRNREANGGHHPAGTRTRDGRLWFPTQDGVAAVDPGDIRRNPLPPPVVIERIVTPERTLPAGPVGLDVIAIERRERNFEIDYTGLSFLAPENMQFRYRLEGLSTEWTEAGNRRTAFYTNVPPGRYTFRVTASNNDGVWNETGAAIGLHVVPQFHETRTAHALLLLTLLLLALAAFRWRLGNLRRRERELALLVETRTAVLRQNERQLEAQNAKLARQADTLADLHEARSRLFANLSHEFRTPLTLILGPLRSMLDGRYGPLHPSAREQGQLMERNAHRLLRLINQILDLASLQAGALTLDRHPHDIVAFTRVNTLAFTPLAERRGIDLRFRTTTPKFTLSFDAEQLEKVLLNLLSNAMKFTDRGGSIEVALSVVAPDDTDAGAAVNGNPVPDRPGAGPASNDASGLVEIAVRDTGVGIAADELPQVFDRFYQADSSATRRYEGTGIGLPLARELVELHGGTILVESTPGRGSTFTVRLPLDGATDRAGVDEGAGAGAPATDGVARLNDPGLARADARGAGRADDGADHGFLVDDPAPPTLTLPENQAEDRTTVLVVDDNADVRAYLRSVLAPSFRIIEAEDGLSGVATVRSALPDLVIADVMMPQLDGLALGRALKADPMTDAIPVVLLTARAKPEDHVAGLETGADAYLVKPFDPNVIEACVANLLAQRRRLRERFRQGETSLPTTEAPAPSDLELMLRPIVVQHLEDPAFGPEALAAAAELSYHQLYRALRDELGVTPSRFIRRVRVETASELLRQGAGNVTEVAYSVGFESLSYFSRAFRERFDAPPSEHLAPPRRAPRPDGTPTPAGGLTPDSS